MRLFRGLFMFLHRFCTFLCVIIYRLKPKFWRSKESRLKIRRQQTVLISNVKKVDALILRKVVPHFNHENNWNDD